MVSSSALRWKDIVDVRGVCSGGGGRSVVTVTGDDGESWRIEGRDL